jgi:hypothetical protein
VASGGSWHEASDDRGGYRVVEQAQKGDAAMDKVVQFGIPVDDEARAKEFYGSINGGLMKRSSDTPAPVITI